MNVDDGEAPSESLPLGRSAEEMVSKILREIVAADGKSKEGKSLELEEVVRSILDSKETVKEAKDWLSKNNSDQIRSQPSFNAFLSNLKAHICTCADKGSWDGKESCDFHDVCEHGVADLVWGIEDQLMAGNSVPTAVRMVATAALTGNSVDEAAAAKAKHSVDSSDASNATAMMDMVAKQASFLQKEIEIEEGDGDDKKKTKKMVLNENLILSMITSKAVYVLKAMAEVIRKPNATGSGAAAWVTITDVPNHPHELASLINFLCADKNGMEYIAKLESRFQFMFQVEDGGAEHPWATMWTKVLRFTLGAAIKAATAAQSSGNTSFTLDWATLLPCAKQVCKGHSLIPQSHSGSVKVEGAATAATAVGPRPGATGTPDASSSSSAASVLLETNPSFHSLYNMHCISAAAETPLNAGDIVVVGREVEMYLLRRAW
eukprot:Skav221995  [mRNA]  locus=scaffold2020:20736:22037:- [translate_table: standard]